MRSDCHVHTRGKENAADVLAQMDKIGLDRTVLLGPHRGGNTAKALQEGNEWLAKLVAADRDRLIGFMYIDPRVPGAGDVIRHGAQELKLRGVKMLPDHWFPYDEMMNPVYEATQEMKLPILFHSGILWGNGDSSRFCRPAGFEYLIHFPKIRFALTHIGWPWTDECIAVCNRLVHAARGKKQKSQMLIDLTVGTPPVYRPDAVRKAIACCGVEHLIFGSDCGAGNIEQVDFHVKRDEKLLAELEVSPADIDRIMGSNLDLLLTPA